MTFVLVVVFIGLTYVVSPWFTEWRRRHHNRVRMTRVERIVPARRAAADRHDVRPPRFTRDDPSPRRRLTDGEWRELADGDQWAS